MNAAAFITALKDQQLVDQKVLTALAASSNFKEDVSNLIKTGVLTRYQVNTLLQGKSVTIGNYVLLDAIGEGGMGQVFKVKNRVLNNLAAMKVIHQNRLQKSQTATKRFKREIQLISKLNHNNIVRAYDADEINGSLILVMEYVEGSDLSKLVKENGPLPVDKACNYIAQVAAGLQHAHGLGMVHRDIKPQNILLNKAGEVKILDMGLARTALESSDETTLTQEGSVVGTADYLAPEQAVSAHNVDIRADIYSLGVTFYYLLTGSVPFAGGSLTEKLLKHQTEDPPPVEKLRPEVPLSIAAIIRKMMAKKAVNRYQTPQEVIDALNSKIPKKDKKPLKLLVAGAIAVVLAVVISALMVGTGDTSLVKSKETKVIELYKKPTEKIVEKPKIIETNIVYLDSLQEKVELNRPGFAFGKGNKIVLWDGQVSNDLSSMTLRGSAKNNIHTHPSSDGPIVVTYDLMGKYQSFAAEVAIADGVKPQSPLLFIVLGDGKVLWESKPVGAASDFQKFNISIKGINNLQLKVTTVQRASQFLHAIWGEPRLMR